ncbi:g6732 [Coccomyxa elongata]
MNNRIVLEQLNRDLSANRAKVEGWAQSKSTAVDNLQKQHLTSVKDLKNRIATMEVKKAKREEEVEQLKKRSIDEGKEVEELHSELRAAEEECEALPKELQEMKAALDRETAELQRQESALADKESLREGKLRSLRQALDLYRARLGLHFRRDNKDELLLVFTHIDPSNHLQEYILGVHVQEDNTYSITKCEPTLEGLDGLLEELNKSNNFSDFVRQLRKRFQQLVILPS